MFNLTCLEDNEVINSSLTNIFHQCIHHKSINVRLTLMLMVRDNIKLISPVHVLEAAYVNNIIEIYPSCDLEQKLRLLTIIGSLIQNVEYLFHNTAFVNFLKTMVLTDETHMIRIGLLRVFVEMKDYIGLKVFEKRLLWVLLELGNSSVPNQAQLFCQFCVVS